MIDIKSRAIKHFTITQYPNRIWLENTLRLYFAYSKEQPPNILITNNDGIFGNWLGPFLKRYFEIKRIRTPIKSPLCNIYAERMVRTFREELIDRIIFFGRKDLNQYLKEYIEYYNHDRSHYSLEFNAPEKNFRTNPSEVNCEILKKKVLGGLITSFSRAA